MFGCMYELITCAESLGELAVCKLSDEWAGAIAESFAPNEFVAGSMIVMESTCLEVSALALDESIVIRVSLKVESVDFFALSTVCALTLS